MQKLIHTYDVIRFKNIFPLFKLKYLILLFFEIYGYIWSSTDF